MTYRDGRVGPVSFHVEAGELVVLRGPNGSGKSSLLRALFGLVRAQGRVMWWDAPTYAPGMVGVYLGNIGYWPRTSVRENLSLHAQLLALPNTAVSAVIADWELGDFAAKPMQELSSGMLTRSLLARTFLTPGPLLVLDEPEQHLDDAWRAHAAERLAGRVVAGAGALVASHLWPELRATREITLAHG